MTAINFLVITHASIGFAYYFEYKKGNTTVEFLVGPTDWQIEMIILTSKQKYTFKDLMEIKSIKTWIDNNRYHKKMKGKLRAH